MTLEQTVRRAEPHDLDQVFDLFQKAIRVMDDLGIPQWDEYYPTKEILGIDIAEGQLFACEIEGRIASVFVLNEKSDPEYDLADWKYTDGAYAIIHRLCVHPDFQRNGVGSETLRVIETLAREKGYSSLRLDVFSQNPYSNRMYAKSGYTKTGEAAWRKGLFWLMEKSIG
jgi:ribosomal protein S18 acetylase RimI-like enzyme